MDTTKFLSTPSARRATLQDCAQIYWLCISIHALREEGDFTEMPQTLAELQFLSTPSARRATKAARLTSRATRISIHALREEGDVGTITRATSCKYFYPRPPRGGRHVRARLFCSH